MLHGISALLRCKVAIGTATAVQYISEKMDEDWHGIQCLSFKRKRE